MNGRKLSSVVLIREKIQGKLRAWVFDKLMIWEQFQAEKVFFD